MKHDIEKAVKRIADIREDAHCLANAWFVEVLWLCDELEAARSSGEEASGDTQRINWLEENAHQLSTVSGGETCNAIWSVFPNELENTEEPQGRGIRAAIDAAMSAPPSPSSPESDKP